ncbi:LexA family protein [Spirosoma flavum]|jgi:DNA polymerase V|uniref:LexA family protein n=1 Tax=Spirosoma flavum TaxID=2048557 RepID=A0ABW6ASY3_9BACT
MKAEIHPNDKIRLECFVRAESSSTLSIPFFSAHVAAGFGNPADSHIEKWCDLNELCIDNKDATYFVYVESDSMIDAHITPGTWLIVDRSKKPRKGAVIVAWVNGAFTVKRVNKIGDLVVLMPANDDYTPIYVHEHDDFKLFGLVTFFFQKPTIIP